MSQDYFTGVLNALAGGNLQNGLAKNPAGILGSIRGLGYETARKEAAWSTTKPLDGLSAIIHPADARRDELGNIIYKSHYGNYRSEYGWEIDHRTPSALGGSDTYENLRALHCRDNRSSGAILGSIIDQLTRR